MPEEFTPGTISYSGRMAEGYTVGRALGSSATDTWRSVIDRWLSPLTPRIVADIGAGTGRHSALIAETTGAQVLALEPSADMRGNAMPHAAVDQIAADTQALPLATRCCDAAWIAYVIHHVANIDAAAREIARVLKPGGRLLLVGGFPDLLGEITLFNFWPETRDIIGRFPDSTRVITAFASAGLAFETVEPITLRTAESLADAAARTRLRADTTLEILSDDAFERGQKAIQAAASAQAANPSPIEDTIHMLVFSH